MGIKNKTTAFTFIEMIVVIGIMSFALPTLYIIFLIFLQQQVKVVRLSQIRNEGTYISNTISNLIRSNAISIHSAYPLNDANKVCSLNPDTAPRTYQINPLFFKDKLNNTFSFSLSTDKISSYSSALAPNKDITSNNVLISNFTLKCSLSGYFTPLVILTYDICYKINGTCGPSNESVSLHFQSSIKMSNFE